jgi:hypothetical protein
MENQYCKNFDQISSCDKRGTQYKASAIIYKQKSACLNPHDACDHKYSSGKRMVN